MDKELKTYLIGKCRDWMLPEEIEALEQIELTEIENGQYQNSHLSYRRIESVYGINCEKIEQLMFLGKEKLEETIANRLLNDHKDILNNCPICGRLARTPKAKQCRHCEHKWFGQTKKLFIHKKSA
jgi:hypothetical protein